jgi:hypothetical protein
MGKDRKMAEAVLSEMLPALWFDGQERGCCMEHGARGKGGFQQARNFAGRRKEFFELHVNDTRSTLA